MSRSYKKSPIIGYCVSTSEKYYKRLRAKLERAHVREAIRNGESPDYEMAPWNEWTTNRDGKRYIADRNGKVRRRMRKFLRK